MLFITTHNKVYVKQVQQLNNLKNIPAKGRPIFFIIFFISMKI